MDMRNTDTIETSAEYAAAQDRFYKLQDRAAENFGYGATREGLGIAQAGIERLAAALQTKVDCAMTAKDWDAGYKRLLQFIHPEVIALVALNCALTGVMEDFQLTTVAENAGKALKHETFASDLRRHNKKLADKIEKWATEKHGNLKYRLQAARSAAKKSGFQITHEWKAAEYTQMGWFAINTMLEVLPDLFHLTDKDGAAYIEVSDGACKIAQETLERFIQDNPVFLPSFDPPIPWTGFQEGGPVDPVARRLGSLVRTRHRETVSAVKAAIKSGQMQPALDAVNAIQATPWRINQAIYEVIKECKARGIAVKGITPDEDYPLPTFNGEWGDLPDAEKKLHRIKRAEIKKANRSLVADRLRFTEDMTTVEALLGGECFYIPHNLDWRGREYPMTNFHFQREDHIRALFLFADFHEPLGEDGLKWLKIHVANCGDFDKVSKKSYADRVAWVDGNIARIKDCAARPVDVTWWTGADKPFLFLAGCMELAKALEEGPSYVCCLPTSWDGSCSGLQHLCAMTRAEEGRHVNLTDVATPQDVYQLVADAAYETIQADAASGDPLAARVLAFDGNRRKIVKRNVMTYSYSSKAFGMAQQHMDDLMEPLKLEVLQGKREKHPFGDEWAEQKAASRYLAGRIHASIEKIVHRPAMAMEFLQEWAKLMAHEGKPLEWVTPVGIPWSNRYHDWNIERVRLWMHDGGVKKPLQVRIATTMQKDIDKSRAANGVAPNFVHACDAAHLLLTVNNAVKAGIKHFALVHDSFGAPPARAEEFQHIIRETFVEMYEKHDVLTELHEQAKFALSEHNSKELPSVVERGGLNIREVLSASYAFA